MWATDLWVRPHDNWDRIRDAGLENQVFPIHAEARTLPYANGFLEALFSVEAYRYFGTDDLYIGTFSQLVKPGGQIGIVVQGILEEFTDGMPDIFDWDFCSFHSPEWWRHHWTKSGKVEVEHADIPPDGWKHWVKFYKVFIEHLQDDCGKRDLEQLHSPAGANIGFSRVVARRT